MGSVQTGSRSGSSTIIGPVAHQSILAGAAPGSDPVGALVMLVHRFLHQYLP
jgi:hypothetical protein